MQRHLVRMGSTLGAALCIATTIGVQAAPAQNFFDRLFGRQPRYERELPPEPEPRRQPVAAPKVQGPQYYTYKVDPLVKVDFAAIAEQRAANVRDDLATHGIGSESPAVSVAPQEDISNVLSALADFDLRAEKDIADAIRNFYAGDRRFIWVSADGSLTHRGEAALGVLRNAAEEGLDPADYAVPAVVAGDGAAAARFEMTLSARVLRYVRDAQNGRVNPNRISGYHDFAPKPLDMGHVLEVLSDTFAVAKYLDSWHPETAQYAALKAELAALRASEENAIVVDPQTFVRPGGKSAELGKILQIIARDADGAMSAEYGALLAANADAELYGQELVPVIKAAQIKAGLKDDGVIGPRTVAAIAGNSRADRLQKVLVAMEQSRWLPQTFPSRHVFINVPAYEAVYVEGGMQKLAMRTVVGKNVTQTFFFQDEIDYVEFHPYWGIPRSILVNTYLPKLYNDPSYLDRIGYEVTDSKGRAISSSSIDWAAYGSKIPFDVRQPPGPKNSLGEMKIMFPNEHAIYMHDTPEKHLFERENRNFSNGCIRLQDPRAMAAAVLGWSRERVEERLKGKHGQVKLDVKVPVYVAYFTAWPDEAGKVHYYHDVYGRDAYVQRAFDRIHDTRAAGA